MSESTERVLNYFHQASGELDDRHDGIKGAISLGCAIVPVIGLLLRNGPLVMLGFSLSAWLGIVFGLAASISGCRSAGPRLVAVIGLILNLSIAGFGAWIVMIGGIC